MIGIVESINHLGGELTYIQYTSFHLYKVKSKKLQCLEIDKFKIQQRINYHHSQWSDYIWEEVRGFDFERDTQEAFVLFLT